MRLAILGSPGVGGGGYRPNVPVFGTPAQKTGVAGTFAPVVANHVLVMQINGQPGTVTVTFTGAENSAATFAATINAQQKGFFAKVVGGQVQINTSAIGDFAGGAVTGGSSADVLASLGMAATPFTASTGAKLINPNYGMQAIRYFGGTAGGPGTTSNQHVIMARIGMMTLPLIVDRQLASGPVTGLSADSTRVIPKAS